MLARRISAAVIAVVALLAVLMRGGTGLETYPGEFGAIPVVVAA